MAPSVDAVLGDKDLLKSIFDKLDLQEVCRAAVTCQLWYQVANHDDFWRQINFGGKKVLPINAAALLQRHPRVEELDLSGLTGQHEDFNSSACGILSFVEHVATHLQRLHKLTYASSLKYDGFGPVKPCCVLTKQLVTHLSSFSSLTCLSLTGVRIAPGSGDLTHASLKHLIMDRTEPAGISIRCPELTFLSMAESPAMRLPNLEGAPALIALDLSCCCKLSEATTRSTLMCLTTLQELRISGMTNFLDQTVQHLGTSLVELTKLDMSHMTGISFQGVRGFSRLRRLDLSRCDQLTPGPLATALEGFACLESLSLDNCSLLNLKLSLSKLKDLSIRGCSSLAELDVRAWQLSRLDMGPTQSPNAANYSLSKLTVTSGALKRMEWNKLNKLSQVDLDCPTLTELVVRDCDFSDAAVLQSLGDTATAPLLNSALLEESRRSAPQASRAPLPSSSTFGTTFMQAAGAIPNQQLQQWMAPVLDDDDNFGLDEMPGVGQQQPGGDDDADDEGGPGGAGGGGGGIQARRYVNPSRMMARQRRIDSIPEWPDRSWQGPDMLPPELVRFGAAVPQPGMRASSSAAAASQAVPGVMGGSSSASAAAAGAGPSGVDAGPNAAAAGPSSAAAATGCSGAGIFRGALAPAAPAAAAAGPSSAAAGGQRARGNMSEALDMGMTWLRSSSGGMLQDRCFIWGSSGDKLQVVASSNQQERAAAAAVAAGGELDAPAQDTAGAADGNMPEPARRRDETDLEFVSRPKLQRLREHGARLTRVFSDGAGPSRSPPQQPAHTRQHHEQQQQQRRRQRLGSSLVSSLSAQQHHARRRMAPDSFGSQSSLSATAEAEDADCFEDAPSFMRSPSVPGSELFSSQQQELGRPRRHGLNPSSRKSVGRCSGGGGGGGWDSSDSDGDAGDQEPHAARHQRCSRIPSGKGGVPRLRVLHVDRCERLQELQLSHQALQEVSVNGCNSLVVVALHAPQLSKVELQELGDLKGACLQQVAVPSLTMGSCSSLQGIELSSKQLVRLDVRGCGGLQQLHLDCPALRVLDANFCGSLADEGLASAVANLPPLRQLALSVCCQIGSTGISSLSKLTTLQDLDLSYTEVSTLQPILESCPHLQSLSIASCRSLGQDALLPLLDPSHPALSQLTSLDASYCDVQDCLVAQLLLKCRKLEHLALSGCTGVTDAIWEQVESVQLQQLHQQGWCGPAGGACGAAAAAAAVTACGAASMDLDDDSSQESVAAAGLLSQALSQTDSSSSISSQLKSLSLVSCSNLRSLCLGLLPGFGRVELLPPKHYLLSADQSAAQAPAAPGSWVEVPSNVSELTSLKVGLSGLQVVALALPKLSHLDLSSCKHLRVLELRCPLLLQLQVQACRALPVVSAVKGVLGCPHLQMLDVQHMGGLSASSSEGQGRGSADSDSTVAGSGSPESMQEDGAGGPSGSAAAAGGSSLLAAVAAAGVLPPAVGCSPMVQIGKLLDEIAATHGTLKAGGILRCTSVCKVCSKLAQCSL